MESGVKVIWNCIPQDIQASTMMDNRGKRTLRRPFPTERLMYRWFQKTSFWNSFYFVWIKRTDRTNSKSSKRLKKSKWRRMRQHSSTATCQSTKGKWVISEIPSNRIQPRRRKFGLKGTLLYTTAAAEHQRQISAGTDGSFSGDFFDHLEDKALSLRSAPEIQSIANCSNRKRCTGNKQY